MTCSAPYSGAGYTVCRCASTQYYDQYQEICLTLKTYLQVCRDSTECADAYLNTGYCGVIPGGSKSVCTCIYNYYATTGTTCLPAQTVGSYCNSSFPNYQCEYNSQCVSSSCTCGSIRYPNSNRTCLYKAYRNDPCTLSTGCWSNNCNSGICN
jgi:hypothetical protein